MSIEIWFLIIGGLLIAVALGASLLRTLPVTTTMVYLVLGLVLGPLGFYVFYLDAFGESAFLERVTEIAVIVSLFTTGMKLRIPLSDPWWRLPVRLAFGSMTITVGLVTLVGTFLLGLPVGVSILLGAVLAPTDPVLASDVQLEHAGDRDRLRFTLTGEAGLNDGTAFPFVMLGLGLLGLHEIGDFGWRWFAVDVVWAICAGLGIGALLGTGVGKLVLYMRSVHKEGFGLDEFLALGLIGLSYGLALLTYSYGFLAVFAAGLALRRVERLSSGNQDISDDESKEEAAEVQSEDPDEEEKIATDPEKAPAYMAGVVLSFNEQMERILEVVLVILVGGMFSMYFMDWDALWFIPVLLLVIRPLAVVTGLLGSKITPMESGLISWLGIRGIGSLYYLMYAIEHGLPEPYARVIISLTLSVVVSSIIIHGITVTPLMRRYEKRFKKNSGT